MFKNRLDVLKYIGLRYKCPFCGGRFRRLLPFGSNARVLKELDVAGGGYRENAICPDPDCLSSDRERMLLIYLRRTGFLAGRSRLLHLAPERGLQNILKALPEIEYVSADIESPLADMHFDITKMPLSDNSFDALICNHVLEHIPDDAKAMSELVRVLRPGGKAIIQVPLARKLDTTYEDPNITGPDEREEKYGQSDHVRLYGMDIKDRLEMAGFSVFVDEFPARLAMEDNNRYAVNPKDILYICETTAAA